MLGLSLPDAIIVASLILSVAMVISARILARREHASSTTPMKPPPSFPVLEYPQTAEGRPVEPSNVPVGPDTHLEIGSRVLAYSQGRWWRAEVIGIEPGGRIRIHWPGWDSKWDTVVPREELQVDVLGYQG